jgi:hypothetical protein
MDTAKKWENYLYNLKDGDLPFLNEKKFEGLLRTIEDVLNIQITLGKFEIENRTKELGYNVLDSDLVYGYYYGFCDVISRSSTYTGVKEIFIIWANVIRHLNKLSNNVKDFSHFFALIQTKFLKDKKSDCYKGIIVGNKDGIDWMKGFTGFVKKENHSGEFITGLLTLLKTHKFKTK